MDNRVFDPEEARQRLEAWKGRIDGLAANTQAMSDRFRELRVTARSGVSCAAPTARRKTSVRD